MFLFLLFPVHSFSQTEGNVRLELVSQPGEMEPGKIQTLVFKVENRSAVVVNYQPQFSVPPGIRLISGLMPGRLEPGKQNIQIISFNIPSKYSAGDYPYSLKLADASQPLKIYAEFKSTLVVKEEAAISVELAKCPEFIQAGEKLKASYIVRNTGNTPEDIALASFNCHIDGDQKITLQPGGSYVVDISSPTDENIIYPTRKSFYLKANGEKSESEQVYGFVKVVPVNNKTNDLYHRFPVTVTSRYLVKRHDGNTVGGYQFEAKGSGSIDPEGKHKIDFLARGPNQFDLSLLGLYDEYRLTYTNPWMETRLGDNNYSLTPLTEYARYGMGFEQKFNLLKSSHAGLMFVSPRFYRGIKAEYGGYFDMSLYKKNMLGFYYLRKQMPGERNVDLYSITTNLQPFSRTSLEMEFSEGDNDGGNHSAYRLNLNSQFLKFTVSSYYFHTGKNYPGYYTNSDFYSGFLNYYATKWLTLGLTARQDFMNAEQDTFFLTAPFSKQFQGLVNIKIGKRMFLKTYARQYTREDRSVSKKFNYETNSLNMVFSHRMKNLGYNLEEEYGKTTNYLLGTDRTKNTYRTTGNVYFQPNSKNYFQGFVTYSNINSFISEQDEDNWIFGLAASSTLARNLRAHLQLQNTYSVQDYYRNRNLVQLNIDYQFLKRHTLSFNSFYTIFQNQLANPDFSVTISYSFNFGIPTKKIAEAGSVSGKIDNKGTGKTKGIVLYAGGQSAITDENGNFSFRNLKPGDYSLMIDRSTLNINDIPDIQTPVEVHVEANTVSYVNFGIVKAAKLKGRLEVEIPKEDSLLSSENNFKPGHIVLELHRDNELIRIISDNEGYFDFPLVRPGKWFLKVYSNGIDKQYQLKQDSFDFDLMPGETKDIKIIVQKKKRNIIFINNNVNLSSGGKK